MLYANGLPQPLSPEDELKYIRLLESGCGNAKTVLVERNLRLVIHIVKKFYNTAIEFEELVSIGNIGLIKAVNTFKPSKAVKLATYASRCISNEILMHLRRNKRHVFTVPLDEVLHTDHEGNEQKLEDIVGTGADDVFKDLEAEADREMLRSALAKLSRRDRLIISARYGLDGGESMTQKQVSVAFDLSQSYISRIEKEIYKRLRLAIGWGG